MRENAATILKNTVAETLIIVFLILIIVAIIDVSFLPLELGFIQIAKYVLKKLNLYGEEKDVFRDGESLDNYAGLIGTTLNLFEKKGNIYQGKIKLNGVNWSAICEDEVLNKDTPVKIVKQDGLILKVKKI